MRIPGEIGETKPLTSKPTFSAALEHHSFASSLCICTDVRIEWKRKLKLAGKYRWRREYGKAAYKLSYPMTMIKMAWKENYRRRIIWTSFGFTIPAECRFCKRNLNTTKNVQVQGFRRKTKILVVCIKTSNGKGEASAEIRGVQTEISWLFFKFSTAGFSGVFYFIEYARSTGQDFLTISFEPVSCWFPISSLLATLLFLLTRGGAPGISKERYIVLTKSFIREMLILPGQMPCFTWMIFLWTQPILMLWLYQYRTGYSII